MKKEFIFNYESCKIHFKLVDNKLFVNATDLAKGASRINNVSYDVLKPSRWINKLQKEDFDDLILTSCGKFGGGGETFISEYLVLSYLNWIGNSKLYNWVIDQLINIQLSLMNSKELKNNKLSNIITKEDLLIRSWRKLKSFYNIVKLISFTDSMIEFNENYLEVKYLVLASVDPINKINTKEENRTVKTYLMKDSNTGYTKIGKAINPKFRESTLQSEKPTISLFAICEENIETELHKRFENKRIRGEWFNLNDMEIESIIEDYSFRKI